LTTRKTSRHHSLIVNRYSQGQRVRLVEDVKGVPAGSEGLVMGFYVRDPPSVVVSVGQGEVELGPDQIEPVDAPRWRDETRIR
jgi:hypothetical protein